MNEISKKAWFIPSFLIEFILKSVIIFFSCKDVKRSKIVYEVLNQILLKMEIEKSK